MCGLASEAENPLKMRSAHHYYPTPAFQLQPLVLLPLEAVKHNIPLHASQRLNMSNMTGLRWAGYYLNKVTCKYNYLFANSFHLTYKRCQSAFCKERAQNSASSGDFLCRVHGTALLNCCLHHIRPMEFLLHLWKFHVSWIRNRRYFCPQDILIQLIHIFHQGINPDYLFISVKEDPE